jgi:hypothetical protein
MDGILTACPIPSRDVPRDRNERKGVEKMGFFSMIFCFRTSFPALERPLPVLERLFPVFYVLLGK